MSARVELDLGSPGACSVKVDGVEMAELVRGITVTDTASDKLPRVTLEVLSRRVVGTVLADVFVSLPEELEALLLAAGWTRPNGATW